jgi:hypothetical protein
MDHRPTPARHRAGAARLYPILLALVFLPLPGTLGGCGAGGYTSDPPDTFSCNFVAGQVTSSTGSSVGSHVYTLSFGGSRRVYFSNIDLTVRGESGLIGAPDSEIVDLGPTCLDSVGGWPGGTGLRLTVFIGHTYLVQFSGGQSYVAFTVEAYSGGVLTFTFVDV